MKPSNNRSDSTGASGTSTFNSIENVPMLKDSSAGSAIRNSLNLRKMTLAAFAVLALFSSGLPGKPAMQESDTAPGNLLNILQVTATEDDPFSGIWVLNISKSKLHSKFSALVLKSKITHLAIDGSDIEIKQQTILESDELMNIHVKARFNGDDYPITGAPDNYSAAFQRIDEKTIEAELKSDGKVIVQETGVISPDGKCLTVCYYFTKASGIRANGIVVLEKK